MGDTLTCKSFSIQVILCCYSTAYIRSIGKHVIELLGLQSLQTRAIKLGKVTDCCMAPRPTLCMASHGQVEAETNSTVSLDASSEGYKKFAAKVQVWVV